MRICMIFLDPCIFVDMSSGYSCAVDFESYTANHFYFEENDSEFGMRFVVT